MFTRQNPSPRYRELVEQYRQMHAQADIYTGTSLAEHAPAIKKMVAKHSAQTLLDYGAGKGLQYTTYTHEGQKILDYWGVRVICYDPAYEPFNKLPVSQKDGVISTDVLEHLPLDDIPWILDEMFTYARRFVFLAVACFPAEKHLPNGENAHATILDKAGWKDLILPVLQRHSHIDLNLTLQTHVA